jgi:hypothetical protein
MWLVVGLFCEGPTDRRFLSQLIPRTLLAILAEQSAFDVEFQEQIVLFEEKTNEDRAQLICAERTNIDLFVVHVDATRPQRERVQDAIVGQIQAIARATCGVPAERIVPLVPIREMEAWILSDPEAIARVLGYESWPDRVRRDWVPDRAEAETDPKRTLDEAVRNLVGRRRGRRRDGGDVYVDLIGAEVDLTRLDRLDSFQRFRTDLLEGLRALRRRSVDPDGLT